MRTQTALLSLAAALAAMPLAAQSKDYDAVIRNGRIIDGTGAPWFEADVAVSDGKIATIGHLPPETSAALVIDAAGKYVAPGFIDVHTHVEGDLTDQPEAQNFVRMGATTLVTGNCGGSYRDLGNAFTSHTKLGIGVNLASLVGHNTVRREVMGNSRRDPTTTEIEEMKRLVEEAMWAGAVGLSTGLIYTPGIHSKTPEIIELTKVVGKYNGIYVSHMRSEGLAITEAIDEALTIGKEAGTPVQISHFKISAPKRHGDSTITIGMVEQARQEGHDVTVDQYVYTASSTNLRIQLPDHIVEGSTTDIRRRINDPEERQKIIDWMIKDKRDDGGRPDMSYARVASFRADESLNGMNIKEIAVKWKGSDSWQAQMETILDMITSGSAGMVYHSIDENDLQRIAAYPNTMFASDSGVRTFNEGVPHPRGYGNNARVIARYVKQLGLLRLEDAIRKMTSLPAQRFGFYDRGVIRPGMAGDLVVFDLEKVNDPSTFEAPHAYAQGFEHVFVNGVAVISDDKLTSAMPGQVLRGPGWRPTPSN